MIFPIDAVFQVFLRHVARSMVSLFSFDIRSSRRHVAHTFSDAVERGAELSQPVRKASSALLRWDKGTSYAYVLRSSTAL